MNRSSIFWAVVFGGFFALLVAIPLYLLKQGIGFLLLFAICCLISYLYFLRQVVVHRKIFNADVLNEYMVFFSLAYSASLLTLCMVDYWQNIFLEGNILLRVLYTFSAFVSILFWICLLGRASLYRDVKIQREEYQRRLAEVIRLDEEEASRGPVVRPLRERISEPAPNELKKD